MPDTCCAYGCKNRRVTGGNIQFFSFPLKDEERLKKWILALRRENFTPKKHTKICSDHFKMEDYLERPDINVPHLKPTAVPSVFKACPERLKKTKLLRKSKRLCDTTIQTNFLPTKKRKSQSQIIWKRKIKSLQQEILKKNEQIKCLKDLVTLLRKKKIDTDTDQAQHTVITIS